MVRPPASRQRRSKRCSTGLRNTASANFGICTKVRRALTLSDHYDVRRHRDYGVSGGITGPQRNDLRAQHAAMPLATKIPNFLLSHFPGGDDYGCDRRMMVALVAAFTGAMATPRGRRITIRVWKMWYNRTHHGSHHCARLRGQSPKTCLLVEFQCCRRSMRSEAWSPTDS